MKKKIKISTAIPASMSGFLSTENPHLTTATLRVFHSGETGDGRLFTKKFSDKIAATIGGTPVVARYDKETDDFEGHAASQSVFGFVPEQPALHTEIDSDGNSWLITEVKLFTERHDVGSIAKKIVGRSQSLELDPASIDVKFIYDEEEEFDKIEFHDGNLIGLSVLGLDQQPAFEGSGFFTETIKADKIEELIAKYNTIPTSIVMETGGESMNKELKDEVFVDDQSETKEDIAQATEERKPELDPLAEDIKPAGKTVIEASEETGAEPQTLSEEDNGGTEETIQTIAETEPEPVVETKVVEEPVIETTKDPETVPGNEGEGDDFESEEQPTKEGRVEPETEKDTANATALNSEERTELENYRRADKIGIIGTYSEYLSQDELQEFIDNVDAFGKEQLDKELSFKSMQALRNKTENKPTFAFNLPSATKSDKASDPVTDAIQNYKRGGQ